MSWSITINDLDKIGKLSDDVYDKACSEHPAYRADAEAAFKIAKDRCFPSACISGGRTPHMYGGPETVTISIVGFDGNWDNAKAVPPNDFNETMRSRILDGPDIPGGDYEGFWKEGE